MTRTHPDQAQALRAEIDEIRADLGETVQALAARADVPARMRAASGRMVERARHSPVPWLVAGGAVGAAVALVVAVLVLRGRPRAVSVRGYRR